MSKDTIWVEGARACLVNWDGSERAMIVLPWENADAAAAQILTAPGNLPPVPNDERAAESMRQMRARCFHRGTTDTVRMKKWFRRRKELNVSVCDVAASAGLLYIATLVLRGANVTIKSPKNLGALWFDDGIGTEVVVMARTVLDPAMLDEYPMTRAGACH